MPSGTTVTTFQPFECLVCQSRFTRHENLKRHAALHERCRDEPVLSCDICRVTFSRADLRTRHMKRKHPNHANAPIRKTPSPGRRRTDKTPSHSPPSNKPDTVDMNMAEGEWTGSLQLPSGDSAYSWGDSVEPVESIGDSSSLAQIVGQGMDFDSDTLFPSLYPNTLPSFLNTPSGAERETPNGQAWSPTKVPSNHGSPFAMSEGDDGTWFPSERQIAHGCRAFFEHVSPFLPFLHRPTFDPKGAEPFLVLGILSLAYQHSEDPDQDHHADSGAKLSMRCFQNARRLVSLHEERQEELDGPFQYVPMVQTYLLIQIYSLLYICGENGSSYGLRTHSKMISLARAGGLMQPISPDLGSTTDLESLWRQFIKAETHKRTLFAVHQIDSLFYQLMSIPRQLSNLEIKNDLPCPEADWLASSAADWAHQRLIRGNSSLRYLDAVRLFLASWKEPVQRVPSFDPYGAISVSQFLIASAREVSGWSTMSGIICTERLQPLQSSLRALGPFMCSNGEESPNGTPPMALSEATWQTAMIEVHMWSPSHTGGIVEGSIDAVLHQLAYLAPSAEVASDPATAKTIQPHVEWFLCYLEATCPVIMEAPWVTLYAYKAFIIAWQLMQGQSPSAMKVVGVGEGDLEGALAWAKKVFHRRQKWQLGKIILSCIDTLHA